MAAGLDGKKTRTSKSVAPKARFVFAAHNILNELPRKYSAHLLAGARTLVLGAGEILFEKKSDVGDGCYWLQKGMLKVSISLSWGGSPASCSTGTKALLGALTPWASAPTGAGT